MRLRRAFTLIEVLVGSALLLAILLVVGSLLLWALDSGMAGQAQQKTQQEARTMLDDLLSDMGMSVIPPMGGGSSLSIPSSVLVPSGYLLVPASDIYTKVLPNSTTPTELESENIVAFTVPNPLQSAATFLPSLLQDQHGNAEFGLVVYYVTDSTGEDVTQYQQFDSEGNPVPASALGISVTNPKGRNQSAEGGHILWKNVYNVTISQPLLDSGGWTINFNDLNGPNGKAVSVGSTLTDPVSSDAVVSLDSGDALEFLVHHANMNNETSSVTQPCSVYQTICDRHVFQIDATALRQVHTHLGNVHPKVARLSGSSAIRTFQ